MDTIDRQILRELQRNARITNEELAEKVHLSPSPCLRRVRKLEANGLIEGYSAKVNQEACGLAMNVFVSVRLEKPEEHIIRHFEEAVATLDEIIECYLIAGNRDYLLRVVAADLKDYERFIRERFSKVPGIDSIESSFAFGHVKQQAGLPL
ncbi:Lrp/AsnC family transcriptional regulator [Pseudoteredinibacter isoporae]|uniref:Lrp/AsnC family leucine-responsive transcriptional regulator n=1 Tax=Pseudoteredinibacter isoporae TaxID=570281 RepID=A0A7X0JSK4_9GAMM|nr:Lrp/AsnC family transcriptional regulator [Pseudoteredinibacter isoporae]MBB6520536.1 Lrp/AsnC family leucine-responsive transcriptional regulator [Pseudoteredinibacter isoporae]NHO86103.1 Lrp/AsnC family transcriptional regulator [Pseudoteredinibacter isoporae]NIB25446.1 Lrp/AsnC family transcriptional regulator [Pseudoteredinibacter isoporae]